MGEFGVNRLEYLFDLKYSDLLCIERGYYRRHRDAWSIARWQTYYLMAVQSDLKKAGIYKPSDLMPLPWDKDHEVQPISDEEAEDLLDMMKTINKKSDS